MELGRVFENIGCFHSFKTQPISKLIFFIALQNGCFQNLEKSKIFLQFFLDYGKRLVINTYINII